ncbi:ribonuclease HII [Desulfobulbus alkaliphilus]|uniref:ribonuclease HII n=1 Tax=Desulfobulbus alkaliphilus TaxID=869814 RepID=UPI0019652DAF|nr:ribonuclease HII [Desulfobulbus alkaliphilus]MBM9536418.1 ribonuclease HII [Desulfobulbus alkaliphilus]
MKPTDFFLSNPACQPGDTFFFERQLQEQGYPVVAGLDEVGRGPLAGPVVAACVILPQDSICSHFKDSKSIKSSRRREQLSVSLTTIGAIVGIGSADPREIEEINILQAALLAMKRALEDCTRNNEGRAPHHLLVDGSFQIPSPIPQLALVKGESKSASIAAASIAAKVVRDRLMADAHRLYPQYGFLSHRGYPTKAHRQAINRYGPCPLHRRTFRGVREYLGAGGTPFPRKQGSLWEGE